MLTIWLCIGKPTISSKMSIIWVSIFFSILHCKKLWMYLLSNVCFHKWLWTEKFIKKEKNFMVRFFLLPLFLKEHQNEFLKATTLLWDGSITISAKGWSVCVEFWMWNGWTVSESTVPKDGYLSKDDQDEVVNSNMEIIRRDGWILDVQRLDGTKVAVHVPERKFN